MDKRFTEIHPQTNPKLSAGTEPSLHYLINYYYTSHGISNAQAKELTKRYIAEWLELEKDYK